MNSKKVTEFSQLISNPEILEYLKSLELERPTQIQSDAIPPLCGAGNFTVQGRTGSGKTYAYLLPVFEKLKEQESGIEDLKKGCPRTVIVLPTRELALQVFGIAKDISHFSKLRIRKLVGGDKGKSLKSVFHSQIDILITTPERCFRAFKNNELKPELMRYLVLDEADQLLEPSFKKTVSALVNLTIIPQTQIFLVSASRPVEFSKWIEEMFPERKFGLIGQGEENVLNHKIETFNITLEEEDKFIYIKNFVKKQEKRNGIVFMGNKARAQRAYDVIVKTGKEKVYLVHKDLEIKDRSSIVEKFRKSGGVLVATDIMTRGIDINHLNWVLNFDLPSEPDYYLHRSGRVGRAGRSGDVFNFITSKDGHRQKRINESLIVQGRGDLKIPLMKKKSSSL